MRILDRYLVREFLIPFAYCIAAFVLVYIIYDLSAHLDNYIEDQVPLSLLASYYLIQLPLVLFNIIPLSVLLAIIYCLGILCRHNEITAMRATGIGIGRIMTPFYLLGVFFTLILFYLNSSLAPQAYEKSEKFIEEHSRKEDKTERPLAFYNPIEERAWAGHWKPGGNAIRDVTVRNFTGGRVSEKYTARRASFLDGEWWFFDGSIHIYDSAGKIQGTTESFSKRRFPFGEKPADFVSSQKESMAMNYRELRRNMAFYPRDSDIYRRKLVDLNHKIARPFVGITIVLIAVPLALRASGAGAAGSAGLCIALGISYYVVEAVSLAMGRGGLLPAWFASWLPNIVFSGIGVLFTTRIR